MQLTDAICNDLSDTYRLRNQSGSFKYPHGYLYIPPWVLIHTPRGTYTYPHGYVTYPHGYLYIPPGVLTAVTGEI